MTDAERREYHPPGSGCGHHECIKRNLLSIEGIASLHQALDLRSDSDAHTTLILADELQVLWKREAALRREIESLHEIGQQDDDLIGKIKADYNWLEAEMVKLLKVAEAAHEHIVACRSGFASEKRAATYNRLKAALNEWKPGRTP